MLTLPAFTGRFVLAIDGMDGAGKTTFADALRFDVPTFRASIDGFHNPRMLRYRSGRDSPEGCYRDSYDYALFRRVLLDPFRAGEPFALAAFDSVTDMPVPLEWQTAPDDALLVIDGVFLHRPELRGLWDHSVWLEVSRDVAESRMLLRDGPTDVLERYRGAQQLYVREADPAAAASVVIDNS